MHGDFNDDATYAALATALGKAKHPLYYLEIPPFLFAPVVNSLAKANLVEGATVMVEKPFGHDLASAVAPSMMNCTQVLNENQILRVDHFLGKQPVGDITHLTIRQRVARTGVESRPRLGRVRHDGRELRGR